MEILFLDSTYAALINDVLIKIDRTNPDLTGVYLKAIINLSFLALFCLILNWLILQQAIERNQV